MTKAVWAESGIWIMSPRLSILCLMNRKTCEVERIAWQAPARSPSVTRQPRPIRIRCWSPVATHVKSFLRLAFSKSGRIVFPDRDFQIVASYVEMSEVGKDFDSGAPARHRVWFGLLSRRRLCTFVELALCSPDPCCSEHIESSKSNVHICFLLGNGFLAPPRHEFSWL